MAKRRRYIQKKNNTGMWVFLSLIVVALFVIFANPFGFNIGGGDDGVDSATQNGVLITKEQGASATIGINAFTGSWGGASSETEVYPIYTILDEQGTKVHTDVNVNSTTSFSVGDKMTIYGTGASYYVDMVEYSVESQAGTVPKIEAYDIAETTDLVITVFDKDDSALTADDNANNTADYAGGNLGADDLENYYIRLEQSGSDETFRLGAILTYYCGGEMDDFKLVDSNWKEANLPTSGDIDNDFLLYDDTNASTSCSIKRAYVPSGSDYIELAENQDTGKLKFVAETDSTTQPTANGDSYFGAVFVDYACERNGAGDIECGWYRNDDNALPGSLGLNEAVTTTGFNGLDVGVAIEPQ